MSESQAGPVTALEKGLQVLGYRFLPPGGFDAAGNLRMPDDFKLPDAWKETIGRVTASPDWEDLLGILGVLATPGSDWSCWRVALSFGDGTLRVVIVRGGTMSRPAPGSRSTGPTTPGRGSLRCATTPVARESCRRASRTRSVPSLATSRILPTGTSSYPTRSSRRRSRRRNGGCTRVSTC